MSSAQVNRHNKQAFSTAASNRLLAAALPRTPSYHTKPTGRPTPGRPTCGPAGESTVGGTQPVPLASTANNSFLHGCSTPAARPVLASTKSNVSGGQEGLWGALWLQWQGWLPAQNKDLASFPQTPNDAGDSFREGAAGFACSVGCHDNKYAKGGNISSLFTSNLSVPYVPDSSSLESAD